MGNHGLDVAWPRGDFLKKNQNSMGNLYHLLERSRDETTKEISVNHYGYSFYHDVTYPDTSGLQSRNHYYDTNYSQ